MCILVLCPTPISFFCKEFGILEKFRLEIIKGLFEIEKYPATK
ncbi:hypothetical protein LM900335_90542 [Listeria monocytogenes]|nr:hypothetical protein LM900335_90542 [Listeria monocytogenes]